jgi:hypothetical protein
LPALERFVRAAVDRPSRARARALGRGARALRVLLVREQHDAGEEEQQRAPFGPR